MRPILSLTIAAPTLCALPAHAETMTPEQMGRMIQALQSRVEALEDRSRRDRADAASARADLRDLKAARPGRASRPAPVDSAPIAVVAPTVAPVAIEPPRSRFDGGYVAAIGGYQFGTQRQGDGQFSSANPRAISGGNVGGAVGYNVTADRLLIGIEARGRKEFDQTETRFDTGVSGPGLPALVQTGCCFGRPGVTPFATDDFTFANQTRTTDRLTREYGADVSARIGMTWEDTLLYVRVGAGADALRGTTTVDNSGTLTCAGATGFTSTDRFGSSQSFVTSCANIQRGTVTRTSKSVATPYTIVGLGVEQNFGPYFARVEGAFLNHFPAAGDSNLGRSMYYTTEVTGAVGYRF